MPSVKSRSHGWKLVLRLGLLGALLLWILARVDLAVLMNLAGDVGASTWAAMALLFALITVLTGLRLALLGRVGARFAVPLTLRAQAFVLAAPAQLGSDAYRVVSLGARPGWTRTRAALVVLLDRAVGGIGLLIFALAAATASGLLGHAMAWLKMNLAPWSLTALIVALGIVTVFAWRLRGQRWALRVRAEWAVARGELRPSGVLGALALSLMAFGLLPLVVAVLMLDFGPVHWPAALSVPPMLVLLTWLLPVTVAGIGVREAAGIVLYGSFSIAPEPALLLSAAPFLASLVVAAAGLLMIAMRRGSAA